MSLLSNNLKHRTTIWIKEIWFSPLQDVSSPLHCLLAWQTREEDPIKSWPSSQKNITSFKKVVSSPVLVPFFGACSGPQSTAWREKKDCKSIYTKWILSKTWMTLHWVVSVNKFDFSFLDFLSLDYDSNNETAWNSSKTCTKKAKHSVHTTLQEWKRRFHSENASNASRPH